MPSGGLLGHIPRKGGGGQDHEMGGGVTEQQKEPTTLWFGVWGWMFPKFETVDRPFNVLMLGLCYSSVTISHTVCSRHYPAVYMPVLAFVMRVCMFYACASQHLQMLSASRPYKLHAACKTIPWCPQYDS